VRCCLVLATVAHGGHNAVRSFYRVGIYFYNNVLLGVYNRMPPMA